MPLICYKAKRFNSRRRRMIDEANTIIAEYADQGFTLTLRQLYYQFVSRNLLKNTNKNYKQLGATIAEARVAGLVDWLAIEDRTRGIVSPSHWGTPADILASAAATFKMDTWRGQKYRPEVWIEKDAAIGIIANVCQELDVAYLSCRGYTSQSDLWASSQRLLGIIEAGQIPVVIHLGDHDPSGLDMTRDLAARLQMFFEIDDPWPVHRIALTTEQIAEYNPPPNPAKVTDSRYRNYQEKHGGSCWELDALEPGVVVGLIREIVEVYRGDENAFQQVQRTEENGRALLARIAAGVKTWQDKWAHYGHPKF